MARCLLCIKMPDIQYIKTVIITDIIILSIIVIVSIIHTILYLEAISIFFLITNFFFIVYAIYMMVNLNQKKEVLNFENFIYSKSRKVWNFLSLLIVVYLLFVTGFRIYGDEDENLLLPFFVLYLFYLVYVVLCFFLFTEMKKVTETNFNDKNRNNYLEGYCYEEKIKKEEVPQIRTIIFESNKKADFIQPKKEPTEKNYLVADGLVYMNQNIPQKKENQNDSFFDELENKKINLDSDLERNNTDFSFEISQKNSIKK
jgi:hypothetical protein